MFTNKRNIAVILGLSTAIASAVAQPAFAAAAAAQTITCPSVADKLTAVPASAQAEVDSNLALLDKQVVDANQRLQSSVGQGGPNFVQNAILGPLKSKRVATIDRIGIAIGRTGAQRPAGLAGLENCTLNAAGGGAGATPPGGNGGNAGGGQTAVGPVAADFVDIRKVQPNVRQVTNARNASRGTFLARCGNNANGHRNPDNFIVAPGVSNGAKHTHDYVGNRSADGFSTDQSLQAAGTTCTQGDRSAYFWPVVRDRSKGGNGGDGNNGQILTPQVRLEFSGNAQGRVRAMPRFLRAITGDAKVLTNGVANARAKWTCTGFTNRVTDKYPICPGNSNVVRILEFPSCLAGNATDSANHRTHIVFPNPQNGACQAGTSPVPKLTMTLTYRVGNERNMAVDSFPEQLHNPATDHADFANVMPTRLMNRVVSCINRGQRC